MTEFQCQEAEMGLDATTLLCQSSPPQTQGEQSWFESPAWRPDDVKDSLANKRVSFPADGDIISGSLEPRNPWGGVLAASVEGIVSAYIEACHKLNVKPINKLLQQLPEITDLSSRAACLNLKGERLDYKSCETLEEIFKRLQFKEVNVESTGLDEDGASALFDMIEYYESAVHLNISCNKHIGLRGWQAAASLIKKTGCLQVLDARNAPLAEQALPFVARALRMCTSLNILHLENANLSGRPLLLLVSALKMNMAVKELYLAENKLSSGQDALQLGNLLKFNTMLETLDLRNNNLADIGLAHVAEGLKEQQAGLVTLVLWNNQLTHVGMGYLAGVLPCTTSLETLNLGHNSVGNEGMLHLKEGLLSNRSLLRLGLAATKIACEGAVAVAEFIAESQCILRVDLRENEVKTAGLMALAHALKVNRSLTRLDLDKEPKKEVVKSFLETQKDLQTEIQECCRKNRERAKATVESQVSSARDPISPGPEPISPICHPISQNSFQIHDKTEESASRFGESGPVSVIKIETALKVLDENEPKPHVDNNSDTSTTDSDDDVEVGPGETINNRLLDTASATARENANSKSVSIGPPLSRAPPFAPPPCRRPSRFRVTISEEPRSSRRDVWGVPQGNAEEHLIPSCTVKTSGETRHVRQVEESVSVSHVAAPAGHPSQGLLLDYGPDDVFDSAPQPANSVFVGLVHVPPVRLSKEKPPIVGRTYDGSQTSLSMGKSSTESPTEKAPMQNILEITSNSLQPRLDVASFPTSLVVRNGIRTDHLPEGSQRNHHDACAAATKAPWCGGGAEALPPEQHLQATAEHTAV
uniref:protein phosphatase 1 regulatory subunit 37-like n=1 Tax=Myxine glutinosa TaxID=7769 RepID=UPI00358E7811